MFIKLTRLDNTPIWLNAGFIVTVEPRKGGGTIVVPVGDGLDYEVREKAEAVLEMLDGAPAPVVVPVPSSDCLTKTPEDVSPEPERPEPALAAAEPPSEEPAPETGKTVRKTVRKAAAKKTTAAKPRKRATKKAAAEEADPADAPAAAEPPLAEAAPVGPPPAEKDSPPAPPAEPAVLEQPALELTDGQVDRLRRMMPRSVRKLANTLMAQFKIVDAMPVIRTLAARGVLRLDENRVIWIG